ncbi:MAG: phage late control D family protein [Caldilineaceae bacterium]|nr:phage late control D family protein [Caldilineaceae bacterium]
MPDSDLRPIWKMSVESKDIWDEIEGDIEEIVVDSSLFLPDMFVVRLQVLKKDDESFPWIDDPRFVIGAKVVIEAAAATIRDPKGEKKGKLIVGEITALEPEFSSHGNHTMLMRGYDMSNRLHFGRVTRTYTEMSDKEIVEKIAKDANLTSEVDGYEAGIKFDYVVQYNQTDAEFLAERAKRLGYQVFVQDSKLFFKKGDKFTELTAEFELDDDLLSFRPRMTVAHQATSTRVVGWDPVNKEKIEGKSDSESTWNQGGMKETGGKTVESKLKISASKFCGCGLSDQHQRRSQRDCKGIVQRPEF